MNIYQHNITTIFKTNLAAPARRFLELGAFGSAARDLAARSSLLDAVEVFFKLLTNADFVSSS